MPTAPACSRNVNLTVPLNVLARHLEPVYDAMGKKVLESPVIHADETRWPLMGSKKKSAGTVWGVSSPDIAYY